MSDKDPFTQVQQGIWEALEASDDFCAQVVSGNRIKFTEGSRDPEKQSRQSADYPQVSVETDEGITHLYADSAGTDIRKVFRVLMLTGDKRIWWEDSSFVQRGLFPLQ